jgi:hypothetical protein
MERKVEPWSVEKIYKNEDLIDTPEFQREPKLWNEEYKRRLIDSILRDIDIPKIYFSKEEKIYYVIDGQQRIQTIWSFLNNEFKILYKNEEKTFAELDEAAQKQIKEFELQVVILKDADDDYLRELFLRLQLGLLLKSGEKLNALSGEMKDFIFDAMRKHNFIESLPVGSNRFGKETLCAQICINSNTINGKEKTFSRTRFDDLADFIRDNAKPDSQSFKTFKTRVIKVLDLLEKYFDDKTNLQNKSFILSIYFMVEDLMNNDSGYDKKLPKFEKFINKLIVRLKEESEKGFKKDNKNLYEFQSFLSNAPGEKYQIKKRHDKLKEYFDYYLKNDKILGD